MERLLLVVPTYNERANIRAVLDGALGADPRLSVLVVDDGSPDGTGEVVAEIARRDPRVHLLARAGKQGLGSAYRAGFAWGLAGEWDGFCQMDADLSHDPSDLPRLLAALDAGADVAIGSRYVAGGRIDGWPTHRLALSAAGNRYVRALTGCPVRDATSGYRAFRRQTLEAARVDTVASEGYAFQIEVVLRCWQRGAVIEEVPITFVERTAGVSKISRRVIVEALWRTVGWGVRIRTGRRLA